MKFIYPAIIYKEDDGYWGEFPDLDGAVSEGDSYLETADNLEEALNGYISSVLDRGLKLSKASVDLSEINKEKSGEIILIKTDIDLNKANKSVKKTLTIPHWLNEEAKKADINFSQILQEALVKKLDY